MPKRFAIYTAIVGLYDEITQPKVIDSRFDYIIFSDCISEPYIGVWKVKHIEYQNTDCIKKARWVKTHPDTLLPEYDCSIWMDANMDIQTSYIYDKVEDLYRNNVPLASVKHPTRQCIYSELISVMELGYENEDTVIRWGNKLFKEHFPQDIGLFETGLFYRIHHNDKVALFNQLWWECIEKYSKRDQLSCNYALWKLGLPSAFILPEGESTSNSVDVCRREHTSKGEHHKRQGVARSYIMGAYLTNLITYPQVKSIYFHIYSSLWSPYIAKIFNVYFCLRLHIRKAISRTNVTAA